MKEKKQTRFTLAEDTENLSAAKQTRRQKAFTLAEVLISLTIIGVIAAITVPTLVQRTNKQEYVTALQKAYSTLSQAANMIIAENGSPKYDDGGWADSPEHIYTLFKKYLSSAKECGSGAGCYELTRKRLNGNIVNTDWGKGGTIRTLILNDGIHIMFNSWGLTNKCSSDNGGTKNICAEIYADINGRKQPNQMGRDIFMFVLKENGIFPNGCDYNNCKSNGSGDGCACKVLTEGAMNY